MKLAILGSTGFVGKVLLKKALDRGHQVKTLVRSPEKLGEFKDRVEFIQGTVFEAADIEASVAGTEAVLSTVAPNQRHPQNPEMYKNAMENLVAALDKQNIKRFIHIGGAVHAGGENENWTVSRRMLRFFLTIVSKPSLIAKQLEWEVLKKSDLDWTLVRPPRVSKKEPAGNLLADEKNLAGLEIGVEELADFILDQIDSKNWIRKAPLVASGKKGGSHEEK